MKEAKDVEEMAILLRRNPNLSDYGLAKLHLGQTTGATRKLANEGRYLAYFRHEIPVKFHKSRGDKNAPTTSPDFLA